MKNRTIEWTLVSKGSGKKAVMQTIGKFPTKRKAVEAMESLRQPKTAVTRVGHTFVFQPA